MDTPQHIPAHHDGAQHKPGRAGRIIRYIHQNLSADLSAAAVAKRFSISTSSLLHIFKTQQHQSYRRYVEKARMNHAMKMLEHGKWIQEIMDATGYKSRSAFYRAFKKTYRRSPRHFQG